MMEQIKPIETEYNGYHFRSRLEARWAVFFDSLGVKYDYEPEGFLINGIYYLPDFYLPEVNGGTWVEVKGKMTSEDRDKITAMQNALTPFFEEEAKELEKSGIYGHMLITVGKIPSEQDTLDIWEWYESVDDEWDYFSPGWDNWYWPCICPVCGKFGFEFEARSARICSHTNEERLKAFHYSKEGKEGRFPDHPRILKAYRDARQARFEHGEKP